MKAIIGKKLGMTQVFDAQGNAIPVTVIEATPGTVLDVKTVERDGYEAMKVAFFEDPKEHRYTKPELGVFKKTGVKPHRKIKELPIEGSAAVGDAVSVEGFAAGDKVTVTSVSKGKGFQGTVRRHNFNGGPRSHGAMNLREPGSIGASSFPSHVWKGKRMAGHMGSDRVTIHNLRVVDVRVDQNLILLRGAVPGGKNAIVHISKQS